MELLFDAIQRIQKMKYNFALFLRYIVNFLLTKSTHVKPATLAVGMPELEWLETRCIDFTPHRDVCVSIMHILILERHDYPGSWAICSLVY